MIESIIAYAFIAYANAKSFEQIQEQKAEIEAQRDLSVKQEKEITSSINYASRIQHAMLPAETLFEENFDEHFIFFRPRDIVSGDFYWVRKIEDTLIIVAADCTGHGVPGAFVSMLGISILNKIRIQTNKTRAGEILDVLREEIKFALKQTGKDHELRDGMDLSLCLINLKSKELQFAGANNHLYIITKNKLSSSTLEVLTQNPAISIFSETADINSNFLIEIKADMQPIGIYRKEYSFNTHTFNIHEGDKIYMFSDGFVDQFGGEKGHKFRSKYFKELLLKIQKENLAKQCNIIENTFDSWKKDRKQIDDVLVMGIKIKKSE
jgi:serine phosphatase RsbU (regulator of sigma subunit)